MTKRIKILTDKEIQELYELPKFANEERFKYFSLNPSEKIELDRLYSIPSKIFFLLDLGYFKAKKMFFMFSPEDLKKDINHIIQQYFTDCNLPDTFKIKISRTTRWTNQSRILQLFNYQLATEETQIKLQEKAARIVTVWGVQNATKPFPVFGFNFFCSLLSSHCEH
ncbi:MAG: DUF4158 domain-containing protein [Flavobacteriaceae bacterium]|nr:DUF4158 domain-containing protein [Flavobacteriaceae bacterium]